MWSRPRNHQREGTARTAKDTRPLRSAAREGMQQSQEGSGEGSCWQGSDQNRDNLGPHWTAWEESSPPPVYRLQWFLLFLGLATVSPRPHHEVVSPTGCGGFDVPSG